MKEVISCLLQIIVMIVISRCVCGTSMFHVPGIANSWIYNIDASEATLNNYNKGVYPIQHIKGDPKVNCVDFLFVMTYVKTYPDGVYEHPLVEKWYRYNFIPDSGTDFHWWADVETANGGAGRPFCGIDRARYVSDISPTCPYCMGDPQVVVLFVSSKTDPVDRRDEHYSYVASCTIAPKVDCTNSVAPYGSYVDYYIQRLNGVVVNSPPIRPCSPGTWLTCKNKPECNWNIPEKQDDLLGDDVYTTGFPPITHCFPCSIARNFGHYVYTDSKNQVVLPSGVEYYCPGHRNPPTVCPIFSVANVGQTGCICISGYFGNAIDGGCGICEAGYMCADGVKTQCPMHTYQNEKGQTACKPCTTGKNGDGRGDVTCDTNQLPQWCDTGVKDTQNRALGLNCVSCTQCRRPYLHDTPNAANTVNCYRG
jgi:hypothetical protein